MSKNIEIGGLAATIAAELSEYTQDIADGVKAATDDVCKKLLENTRADAPEREGKYKRAMAIKTEFENNFEKRNVWYVKKPHYRKTHLLEKGHAKKGGGRVRAYPHIKANAEAAINEYDEKVKGVIENAGK